VRETLKDLEARKNSRERSRASVGGVPAIEIHPKVADLYRRKVSELQSLLVDEAARAKAMEAVRALIERIEVHAGEKRGEAEVVLVGALARILDFGSEAGGQQKKPPLLEAAVGSCWLRRQD
jgi:hypothetical protein